MTSKDKIDFISEETEAMLLNEPDQELVQIDSIHPIFREELGIGSVDDMPLEYFTDILYNKFDVVTTTTEALAQSMLMQLYTFGVEDASIIIDGKEYK
ncbi:hypothetical protein HVY71_12510 [Citrobacter freundii]|uniref:hypothetical protein n=1 Tax=Citrobacter portucalensis TaxID=1639133 RepID=UPI0015E95B79|nr:hypothetical protein HVY71_12510 [Citrobacter freundii]